MREMCSPVDTNYMKCSYLQQPAVMDGWRGGVRRQRGDMDGRVEGGREEGVDGQRWKERGRGHEPSGQPRQIDAVQSRCVSRAKVAGTFSKKHK